MRHLAELRSSGPVRMSEQPTVVEVTEKYARRTLHIPKDEPLVWKGVAFRCIGSKRWRENRREGD